ncbi:hypothetical protein HY638_03400 [Candidatus Woesearchaeota archaeon]|nr:hypothetical protein [Candidatus Woesearchaeota archaeon]
MHEQKVLKIAYISSVAGILFLFYLSQTVQLEEKNIDDISESDIGKTFLMQGKVVKVASYNNSVAVTIMQENTKTAFFGAEEYIPSEGDFIRFRAKLVDYDGRSSLEGSNIILQKS